ncbi:hypothetical protein CRUP_038599, partial [Coryphaenoides rupestris]
MSHRLGRRQTSGHRERDRTPNLTSVRYIAKILDFHHPHQLKDGLEGFSLNLPDHPEPLEQILVDCRDTLKFTYEVSPVFLLIEEVLLRKMQSIVGWSNEEGDGIFCPGGAVSNLYSMLVARYALYPDVKTKGMNALPRLALFTSEHSHYSVRQSAAVMGLGSDSVQVVLCDERYFSQEVEEEEEE